MMKHCVSCLIYYYLPACPEGDDSQKCCKLFGKSRPLGVEGNYIFQPFLRGKRPVDYYTAVVRFHRKTREEPNNQKLLKIECEICCGTSSVSRPSDKRGGGGGGPVIQTLR